MTRVEIIENSLSCFRLGLFGLLPVIGITCAVRSLLHYRRLTSSQSGAWNPARAYLRWGVLCARLGLVVSLLAILVFLAFCFHLSASIGASSARGWD
jgi:hypothetical protein